MQYDDFAKGRGTSTRVQTDAENLGAVDILLREQGKEIVTRHVEMNCALVVCVEAVQHGVHTWPSLCERNALGFIVDSLLDTQTKPIAQYAQSKTMAVSHLAEQRIEPCGLAAQFDIL